MKATLESRKSVRLNWFKQKKIPFELNRTLEWSYYENTITANEIDHQPFMQYVFSSLKNPIPTTNIIMFQGDLPQSYLNTTGSVGNKFSTEKTEDPSITILDRIVKVNQGEEKVTKKPVPPHEAHRFKELQIHERRDEVTRKITLKNETNREISVMDLVFIENKEIQFIKSNPTPNEIDAPEYKWKINIPAESSIVLEIKVENNVKLIYKIERTDEKNGKQRS